MPALSPTMNAGNVLEWSKKVRQQGRGRTGEAKCEGGKVAGEEGAPQEQWHVGAMWWQGGTLRARSANIGGLE